MLNFIQIFLIILLSGCKSPTDAQNNKQTKHSKEVIQPGAYQTSEYFKFLHNKKIGLVINQTSCIGNTNIADSLIRAGFQVQKIFAPEHGFRGQADAGEEIKDGIDLKTGVQIISLYGNKKIPSNEDLKNIDILIFDIQDVGVRFYTYISTLHYIMEASAKNGIPLIVLDRPNPLGFYIDGPVLVLKYASFVGMHPIPIVYGLTIGELAQMINGESWLKTDKKCGLKIVTCKNYDHSKFYELPIAPSPNLRTQRSILLYPSLCLFEGTKVSVGRGTEYPFEVYGYPGYSGGNINFTPIPTTGAKDPLYNGLVCNGFSLNNLPISDLISDKSIKLNYLLDMYQTSSKSDFFLPNNFFNKLAGNEILQEQIKSGMNVEQIRSTWKSELEKYNLIRKKYLLYKDFQ